MKRICIFGGSFDPITNAHIDMIEHLSNTFDSVWISVNPDAKYVNKDLNKPKLSDYKHRYDMVSLVVDKFTNVYLRNFINDFDYVSTYDLMNNLTHMYQHTDIEFWFCIGGDCVKSLPSWHKFDILHKLTNLYIFDRDNELSKHIENCKLFNYEVSNTKISNISSTMIRNETDYYKQLLMTDLKVVNYFITHSLYRQSND